MTRDGDTVSVPVSARVKLKAGQLHYAVAAARGCVAAKARLGLRDRQVGCARQLHVGGLIVDLLMSTFLLPTFYAWWSRPGDRLPAPTS